MRSRRIRSAQQSYRRATRALLFLEPLEDRRLLATFVDAVDDSAATNEDTPVTISVRSNDTSDTPWLPPKVVSVSQPANGSATLNFDRTVTYTPAANFSGTDSFTYTIWDSSSKLLTVTPRQSTLNLHARANASTLSSTAKYDFGTNMQNGTVSRLSDDVYAESTYGGTVRVGAFGEATWTEPAQGQFFLNNVIFDRLSNHQGSASLVEGSGWTYQFTPATSGMFILEHDIRVTNTYGLQELGEFRLGWKHGTTDTFQLINEDNRANAFGQTALPVQGGVTYTVSLHTNFSLAWGSQFAVTDREAMSALFSFRIVETPLADTATVTVSVASVADAPIASGWQFGTDYETPLHELLRASDADGDALTYSVVQNPVNGTLTVNPNTGNFVYTPNPGYIGTDRFTFKVNDGTSDSNIADVFVTVRKPNNPPVANDDVATTTEDTEVNISWWLNDSDPDGESPSLVSYTEPANGTVTIGASAPFFRYTPNPNFSGTDTFSYTIRDRAGLQDTATVTVTVGAVNDRPVANNLQLSTDEDSAAAGQVSGSDAESAVTFAVATGPTSGVLSSFNTQTGAFVYTPNPNFNGTDTFTFTANDGAQASASATVTITVAPVNDTPAALPLEFATSEDTPLQKNLSASDIDGDQLTYWIVDPPTTGGIQVNLDTGLFTYIPSANFSGTDRFTYRVYDGTTYSNTAEVLITVSPVNDPPLAPGGSFTTDEDTPLSGALLASDAEGSPLTYAVVQQPAHGTVTVDPSSGAFVYTPAANYFGNDVFTYQVNDGSADSNTARVALTVRNVNDPPVANDDSADTSEDADASIFVLANDTDADGEPLTIASFSQGANGTVVRGVGAPFLRYTPSANFFGTDTFTYTVRDAAGALATATVTVNVSAVNDRPTANPLALSTGEDSPAAGQVSGSDVESSVTFSVATGPANGVLSSFDTQTGAFVYTPNPHFYGSDSFTFTASDGSQTSEPATVTITVAPVNDSPTASVSQHGTWEDTPLQGVLRGTDIDGDQLTFWIVDKPASGGIQVNGDTGAFTYTPDPNFHGTDTFTFRVHDGKAFSDPAPVFVSVSEVNDPPVTVSQNLVVEEDGTARGQLTASDVDSPAASLTFAIVTQPARGVLSLDAATGAFNYVPHANFAGDDFFTFTASDGGKTSNRSTVYISVTPVNDAPVAAGAAIVTDEDASLQGTLSAGDIDGDSLTYSIVNQPASGSIQLDASTGAFTYTPTDNYAGADAFSFRVFDGQAYSEPAQFAVTVREVNDLPTAVDQVFTLTENAPLGAVVGTFVADDIEDSILSFALSQAAPAAFAIDRSTGEITVANAALIDYEANPTFQLQVHVTDSDGGQTTASVTVNLIDVLEMAIDIVPGDSTNRIDLGSATIEVAILASVGFDPLAKVDLASLRLRAPGSTSSATVQSHPKQGYKYELRDVNGDGRSDLVVRFTTTQTGLKVGDTSLQLSGSLKSGESFLLAQAVTVVASTKGGGKGGGGKGNK